MELPYISVLNPYHYRSTDTIISGVWRLQNPYYRPGVVHFQTNHKSSIKVSDQGIYTCTIPDSSRKYRVINIGLYPYGFHCELFR